MDTVSEKLKDCGVKICTMVRGGEDFATGTVYVTSQNNRYDYILTAKHTFLDEEVTTFSMKNISYVDVFYYENKEFKRLEHIGSRELPQRLIVFDDEDFVIIKINKNHGRIFPKILVSDSISKNEDKFISWSVACSNEDTLHYIEYVRNDPQEKRFQLEGQVHDSDNYNGISGSGVFSKKKTILYGIIRRYPYRNFENNIIECHPSSFEKINTELQLQKEEKLKTTSSKSRRIIGDEIIDIRQAVINGVSLDLSKAIDRLKQDIRDDFYIDSLYYADLLNWDFLFNQLRPYFEGKKYKACQMEAFFVPKKEFTLRQALISPFIDRIIYSAVVGVLAPKLDNAMIPNVYSARYNHYQKDQLIINGVEQWKKMKYKLSDRVEKYNCIIEVDLLNYYDNINKKLLYNKILNICETPNEIAAAKMLYEMLQRFSTKEIGLPQNCDASSLLASFYLNQVDSFMLHHSPDYYRFMDDIRIFCSDKYEARKLFQTLEMELRRCQLSINSQKSKIIEFRDNIEQDSDTIKIRSQYINDLNVFDLSINKIERFIHSKNYQYLNEAFHSSVDLLKKYIEEDYNESAESSRKLKYALSVITRLGKKKIVLSYSSFYDQLKKITEKLRDTPWLTPQTCAALNVVPQETIEKDLWDELIKIVLNEKYNTYSWQTYQIWMLLAHHKYYQKDLVSYAIKAIESNDETKRPAIAAMMLYMGAVDSNYRRIILRKFGEGFTHGYFQNRAALIILRSFSTGLIPYKYLDETLSQAHPFLHKYKDKELVYIPGLHDDDESENLFDQFYSV